jgi:hypothetical protein
MEESHGNFLDCTKINIADNALNRSGWLIKNSNIMKEAVTRSQFMCGKVSLCPDSGLFKAPSGFVDFSDIRLKLLFPCIIEVITSPGL